MLKDQIGDRMKEYEDVFRQYLPNRLPVVIRVDGSHFHTYTKGCKRPIDDGLVECMNLTAIELCKNLQGSQMAFVQSDEISVLLNNYKTLDTQPIFENNLQKIVSVAASIAGATFTMNSWKIWAPKDSDYPIGYDTMEYIKPAYFDARAFVLPKEDVCNYALWRQQDATRNSVQMLARTLYSHKQLDHKNGSELQEMIFQKGINWNDCPVPQKRGRCIIKTTTLRPAYNPKTQQTIMAERNEWTVDNNIPVFSQDRRYIDKYVYDVKDRQRQSLDAVDL